MTESFLTTYAVAVVLIAAAGGWGRMGAQILGLHGVGPGFAATLGLGAWIAIGGVLNLTGFATMPVLAALLVAGLVAFVWFSGRWVRSFFEAAPAQALARALRANLATLLCLVLLAVLIHLLLPAKVFNLHDDFHVYMLRPIRMLATGSVAGNPLDYLGLDSFGAQSFLQGFILLFLPPAYLGLLDPILCLCLSLVLLTEWARRIGVPAWASVIACALLVLVSPQQVNLSALYSGSLMAIALVYAAHLHLDADADDRATSAVPVALFLAATVALKFTLGLFALCFFVALAAYRLARGRTRTHISGVIRLALYSVAALAPWFLASLPFYLRAVLLPGDASGEGLASVLGGEVLRLFSYEALYYGGNAFDFGLLWLFLALLLGYAVAARDQTSAWPVAIIAAVAALATYPLNGLTQDSHAAIRYSAPVFLAIVPCAGLMLARGRLPDRGLDVLRVALVVFLTVVAYRLVEPATERLDDVLTKGNTLAFDYVEGDARNNVIVLGEQGRNVLRSVQSLSASGATIAALVSVPFQLDFARNTIVPIAPFALALNPWLNLPERVGPIELTQLLRAEGVRYVLWQHRGYATLGETELTPFLYSSTPLFRRFARVNLDVRESLRHLIASGAGVYSNQTVALIDLAAVRIAPVARQDAP